MPLGHQQEAFAGLAMPNTVTFVKVDSNAICRHASRPGGLLSSALTLMMMMMMMVFDRVSQQHGFDGHAPFGFKKGGEE